MTVMYNVQRCMLWVRAKNTKRQNNKMNYFSELNKDNAENMNINQYKEKRLTEKITT